MKIITPLTLLTTILLTVTSFSITQAQERISGVVVNKTTSEPIPFATVLIGENYGVVTNGEGDFSLNISAFQATDSLLFLSMGFQSRSIALKDFQQDTVSLSPEVTRLDAVFLQEEKLTARQVMERVKKNLAKNYAFTQTQFTVFNRNKTSMTPQEIGFKIKKARNMVSRKTTRAVNKTIDSLGRTIKGATSTIYRAALAQAALGETDSIKIHLEKATTLINKNKTVKMNDFTAKVLNKLAQQLDTANTFKLRTGIIPLGDSIDVSKGISVEKDSTATDSITSVAFSQTLSGVLDNANLIADDSWGISFEIGGSGSSDLPTAFLYELDDYVYHIEGVASLNNDFVYIISFKPDHGLFGGNQGRYNGTLYVSTDSYAILKEVYHLAPGEHGSKFNMKFLLGIKYVEKGNSGTVIFQKTTAGSYFPKYIRTSGNRYAYFSRNFVLKENDDNRQERIKLKFDITFEANTTYQDEWLFVNNEQISTQQFKQFKTNDGIINQQLEHYNSKIWEDYNTIAPTEAIKEYKF